MTERQRQELLRLQLNSLNNAEEWFHKVLNYNKLTDQSNIWAMQELIYIDIILEEVRND